MKYIKRIRDVLYQNDMPKILTAITSQGLLSISNFAIGILMAKYAEKSEYGMYVILFSILGIFTAYQNAIINSPLIVLVNNKKEESEKKSYVSGLTIGKYCIAIPLVLLFIIGDMFFSFTNDSSQFNVVRELVLIFVVIISLSKEFIRTLNFVALNTEAIFKMDVLNVIAVLIGMFLLVHFHVMNSTTGVIVLGFGYLAAYLYGKKLQGWLITSASSKTIKRALKENWDYGKWSLLGVTSSLVQDRGYIYIVTAFLGLSALAEVSAARLFLMPIGLLNVSCSKIVVSKGSKMVAEKENKGFRSFIISFIFALLMVWLLYSFIILSTSDLIVQFLGEKYKNAKNLILLWVVFFFVYTIRMTISYALIVYRQFKKQAKYDIVGSSIAIATCFILIPTIGRSGAIVALILGESITMALYLLLYAKFRSHSRDIGPGFI